MTPLELVWVNESKLMKNDEDDLVQRLTAFELIIPNQTMILAANSGEEKEKWVQEIKALINGRLDELDSDTRNSSFLFPNVGLYEGYWLKGKMHGEGSFTSVNNSIYKGNWHSILRAGFGQIILENKEVLENVGWEYSVPFTGVIVNNSDSEEPKKKQHPQKGEHQIEGYEEELTKRDYDTIISAKYVDLLSFEKGETILNKGELNINIYLIKSGEVHSYRNERIIEYLKPPMVFGELAIFDQASNTNYIAASHTVLYAIDINELYRSFFLNNDLSKRFNLQIAKNLAHRLIQHNTEKDKIFLNQSQHPETVEESSSQDSSPSNKRKTNGLDPTSPIQETLLAQTIPVSLIKDTSDKLPEKSDFPYRNSLSLSNPAIDFARKQLKLHKEEKSPIDSPPPLLHHHSVNNANVKSIGVSHFRQTSDTPTSPTENYAIPPRKVKVSQTVPEIPPIKEKKKNSLINEFPVWSKDTIVEVMKYFTEDVSYHDVFLAETITSKHNVFTYFSVLQTYWPSWTWVPGTLITTGSSSAQKCSIKLALSGTEIITIQSAIVWTEKNSNDLISSLEILWDPAELKNYQKIKLPKFAEMTQIIARRRKSPNLIRNQSESFERDMRPRSRSLREQTRVNLHTIPITEHIDDFFDEQRSLSKSNIKGLDYRNKPRIRSSSNLNNTVNGNIKIQKDGSIIPEKEIKKQPNRKSDEVLITTPEPITTAIVTEKSADKTMTSSTAEKTRPPKKPKKERDVQSSPAERMKSNPKLPRKGLTVTSQSHRPRQPGQSEGSIPLPLETKDSKTKKEIMSPRVKANSTKLIKRDKLILSKKDTLVSSKDDQKFWWEKFDFTENEKSDLIKEFRCLFLSGTKLPSITTTKKYGTVYLSNQYICYFSGFFGMNTREVIPIRAIDSFRLKEFHNTLSLNINKKLTLRVKSRYLTTNSHITFTFGTYNECTEFATIIEKLLATFDDREGDIENGDSPRTAVQVEMNQYTVDQNIPNIELITSKNNPSIRLWGPMDNSLKSVLGSDICAMSVSTYPRLVNFNPDGSSTVQKSTRLGDPICDQYCFERYQNRTIFAIADGCNWGPKVRLAAKIAATTFIEYNKKYLFDVDTTQSAVRCFMQSFVNAHSRIIEGHEESWWECGTTTLLGGAIFEINDPIHKWAFVCLSIGDCRAYHISLKNKIITNVTHGSRTGTGALDARDCGGRLGPHMKKGNPDLRNLAAYFQYVEEGDLIIVATDGVYDNLDPQSLGISLSESKNEKLIGKTWSEIDDCTQNDILEAVEEWKTNYSVDLLGQLIEQITVEHNIPYTEIDCVKIAQKLIQHSQKVTKKIRKYMEGNPNNPQPADASQYPGKVDHVTCLVAKVGRTNFRQREADLRDLVVRLRHPTYGLTKEAEGIQKGTFKGSDLVHWISKDPEYSEKQKLIDFCQDLMNFNYVGPVTANDSFIYETFNPDLLYQFKLSAPIMTHRDWKIILQGTTRRTYKKGDILIKQDTDQNQIYQLLFGTCHIERSIIVTLKEHSLYLGTIGPPQTLGEVSLLTRSKASASVVADSDEVEVLILERNFINIMLVRYPDMAGRFYHYLAGVLARRLNFHEAESF